MDCSSRHSNEEGEVYRLYVSSIDPSLTEGHIKDLFLRFGNIVHVYRPRKDDGPGWAFVSYASKREADLAILELNEVEPHKLKVKYARGSKEKVRVHQGKTKDKHTKISEDHVPSVCPRRSLPHPLSLGRGRGFYTLNEVLAPGYHTGILGDYGLYGHSPYELDDYFPSYVGEEYSHTNSLNMRGVGVQSGLFDVTRAELGYDTVVYSDKEKRKICEGIEKLCISVNDDMNSGNCSVCKTLTTQCCQRCGVWYCSQTCQRADWHKHRSRCIPCGATQGINSVLKENEHNHQENAKKKNRYNPCAKWKTSNKSSDKLREVDKSNESFDADRSSVPEAPTDIKVCKSVINESHSVLDENDTHNKDESTLETQSLVENQTSESVKDLSGSVKENEVLLAQQKILKKANMTKVEIKSPETVKLSKDKFEKVKVTVPIGPLQCWVQLVDSETKLLDIMAALNDGSKGSPVKHLKQGMICAALYEDMWYRGKVTSVEPELKVLYIDFGNEEHCMLDQLRILPAAVENIPALAVKIKLAEGTSKKLFEDEILNIKCVNLCGGTALVCVEGEKHTENKLTPPSKIVPQIPSKNTPDICYPTLRRPKVCEPKRHVSTMSNCAVLDLKVGMKGACRFRQWLPDRDFGVTIVYPEVKEKFNKLYDALIAEFRNTLTDEKYRPQIGETVAAFVQVGISQETETWSRARVLAIQNDRYQVNFCDLGHFATVKSVYKLPQELASLPEFGARCTIIKKVKHKVEECFKERGMFRFTVLKVSEFQRTATCSLHLDLEEEVGTVVLRQWKPFLKQRRCLETSLKDNDKVVMPVFFDLNSLFFRPMHDEFTKFQQDINSYCMSASDIDHIPTKNEIVGCRYQADGHYYRARILQINKNKFKVVYIDFGNFDCVDRSSLRLLSANLRKIPAMAVKVSFKDIANKKMTKNAVDLLMKVVKDETEMEVAISGPLKGNVRLIFPDGKNLYDEVKKCLEQEPVENSTEQKAKENKMLTESDIKYMELPIGETVDLFILHKVEAMLYMGCEAKKEVMSHVHGAMSEEMNKYCESTSIETYEPKYRELCFARFEDELWYRGICLSNGSGPEYEVLFVDFGNTSHIDKKNIRKMTEDFIKIPALAVLCSLNGLVLEELSELLRKQLDELIEVNKIYKAKIASCEGLGNYTIEFPHVTKMLNNCLH